jgi:hypothetical protein
MRPCIADGAIGKGAVLAMNLIDFLVTAKIADAGLKPGDAVKASVGRPPAK